MKVVALREPEREMAAGVLARALAAEALAAALALARAVVAGARAVVAEARAAPAPADWPALAADCRNHLLHRSR